MSSSQVAYQGSPINGIYSCIWKTILNPFLQRMRHFYPLWPHLQERLRGLPQEAGSDSQKMQFIRYLQTTWNQLTFRPVPQTQRYHEKLKQAVRYDTLHASSEVPAAIKEPKLSKRHPWKGACLPQQSQIMLQWVLHQQVKIEWYGWLPSHYYLLRPRYGKWRKPLCYH